MNDLTSSLYDYEIFASASANDGEGWMPIGNGSFNPTTFMLDSFTGSFDGQNNTISNLRITRTGTYIGLFGFTMNNDGQQRVQNLILENVDIKGSNSVGSLIGAASGTHVENITVSGKVSGNISVGGLVGLLDNEIIENSYAIGFVTGTSSVGGLVGEVIANCWLGYHPPGEYRDYNRHFLRLCGRHGLKSL
jgi:hypothetical protein